MQNLPEVKIYTDGACIGNPGPGGWAAILTNDHATKLISGGHCDTTNNRMEMLAVLNGLKALRRKCSVNIYSDSKYIVDAINSHWLDNWKNNGWITSSGNLVKNKDLWEELIQLLKEHDVRFNWVKGHNGDRFNEECDRAARENAQRCSVSGSY